MADESVTKIIEQISPYYAKRAKDKANGIISYVPEAEHSIIYDSSAETLEPIYFWILDTMNDLGFTTEKLVDNFA
jgi:hypothetical protein